MNNNGWQLAVGNWQLATTTANDNDMAHVVVVCRLQLPIATPLW